MAFIPFIVFLIFLIFKKTSLLLASAATLISAMILFGFYPAPFIKGFATALDILLIILGAIFFLSILKKQKIMENICYRLSVFSPDYRVQIILLAWFLENFIEGTAGFGTPAAIVAPILVGLGLTPLTAAVVALLGNSASVVFGAAGTPIRVGFAGLNTTGVPLLAASINIVGFLVPIFMLLTLKAKHGAYILAGISGLAFCLPAAAATIFGQEFPSIIGSIAGLFFVLFLIKNKIFLPKNPETLQSLTVPETVLPLSTIIFPYALLIILMVAGKIFLPSFNPGYAFMVAGLITFLIFSKTKTFFLEAAKISLKQSWSPFLVIALMSTFTQIMIYTGQIKILAHNLVSFPMAFLAPFLGMFGAFLTGSATVSNIMFGSLMETPLLLALLVVGGAAGNMIALADILAAEAVLKLHQQELKIIRAVIVPCLIYVSLVALLGTILSASKIY